MIATSKKSGSSEVAWWAVFLSTLAIITFLLLGYQDAEGTNPFPLIFRRILDGRGADAPWTEAAIMKTVGIVLASVAVSLIIGIVVGVMQLAHNRFIRFIGTIYVEALRGIPIYVMLLFVYFGLRPIIRTGLQSLDLQIFGYELASIAQSPFWFAVIALGVCYGAYTAEVVRAGILAIAVEEIEAASLEGNRLQVLWHVILPQALRMILPAIANECIALTKDSALVGVVTIVDITRAAQMHSASTYRYFETFFLLALIYLVLSLILSRIQRGLERAYGDVRAHRH